MADPRAFHLVTRLIDGGATNALLPIATEVEGYDVTVGYGAEFDRHNVAALREAGVRTERFPLMRHYNPVTAVGAVVRVARYVRRGDFDVVHTHSTEAGIIGRAAARLAGTPNVVHTIHGVPFTDDRNVALNRFVERCEVAVAPWTDVMVSIADVITGEYLDRGIGVPDQYETVHYGIDLDTFRQADPADDLPGSGDRILMVARLAEGKGFDVLFDAVERLDRDLSVLIAGDGPLREDLERDVAARGLDDTVHLLGYRDDIPSVMAGSDLLVLPSFREGTPFVIVEAMASGLPVVATDVAGIPELVEDGTTGYLVPPGDDAELAANVADLLDDDERRRTFGRNGSDRADHFRTERMVDDYRAIYDELTGR
ncbi:glycosyltransferase family 1 protein [Halobacteriales archaeon QS_1_68_20]|nr:MAG: glycosyltransferase family 1 protein [Halobacteriales archaeon QS_1_68_20]